MASNPWAAAAQTSPKGRPGAEPADDSERRTAEQEARYLRRILIAAGRRHGPKGEAEEHERQPDAPQDTAIERPQSQDGSGQQQRQHLAAVHRRRWLDFGYEHTVTMRSRFCPRQGGEPRADQDRGSNGIHRWLSWATRSPRSRAAEL